MYRYLQIYNTFILLLSQASFNKIVFLMRAIVGMIVKSIVLMSLTNVLTIDRPHDCPGMHGEASSVRI